MSYGCDDRPAYGERRYRPAPGDIVDGRAGELRDDADPIRWLRGASRSAHACASR